MDVNREAAIIVDLSTQIEAPLDVVWRLHTAVGEWPSWQPDITAATLDGPLERGAVFTWQTHGLQITSTVAEIVPARRIVWGGPAHGIDGVHVWTFEPGPNGVLVRTVESWDGPPVAADPDGMRAALTASLTAWLAVLKRTAEQTG